MDAHVAALFRFAADLSLKATLLFGLTALALLALRRRPASIRHLVGALGLSAALLFPILAPTLPRVEVPVLPPPVAAPPAVDGGDAPVWLSDAPAAAAAGEDLSAESPAESLDVGIPASEAVAPSVSPTVPTEAAPWGIAVPSSVMAAALGLWIAGVLALLARLCVGIARVRRCRAQARPVVEPDWLSLAAGLQAASGVRQRVPLVWSDSIPVAVTSGMRRPVLILPAAARHWDPPRRRVVLLHELAHVARRDWPALLVAEIAVAVYWFHPLAWILARRLRRDAERAADDRVLAAGTKPSVYAGHLLGIIRALRPGSGRLLPVMGMARPSHFEERLRAILAPDLRRRGLTAGQARMAAVVFLAAASSVAVVQPWATRPCEAALPSDLPSMEAPMPITAASAAGKPERSCSKDPHPGAAEDPGVLPGSVRSLGAVRRAAAEAPRSVEPVAPSPVPDLSDTLAAPEPRPLSDAPGIVLAAKHAKKGGKSGQWYRRGAELHEAGDYEAAITEFEKSYETGYKPGASAYNAGCGYARLGQSDAAFTWLEKAAAAGFDVLAHLGGDEDLEGLRSDPRLPELRGRLREEELKARSNETSATLERFGSLSSRFPQDAAGLYGLGKELLDLGQYPVAADAFRLSARAGIRVGASLYNTACALSLAGDRAGALDALQQALEAGFDNPGLLRKDSDLDGIRGEARYRDLLAMSNALALEPFDEAGGKETGGGADLRRASWARAARRYEQYASAHPELGRAWFNLGFARLSAGENAGAAQAFEKALGRGYREPTTMYNLACSYARMDRKEEAFDWLFRALESGLGDEDLLRRDEDLDSLRGEPRFPKALKIAEKKHTDS